ncbi:MAG: sugar ABC transporter permease [Spirochaetales bacterium]|nr:sugar ABC transporter permease [Spirochaetales bacterium]
MYQGSPKDRNLTIVLFLAPVMLVFLVFKAAPLVMTAGISLLDWDVLKPFSSARFVGMKNFSKWFSSGELWNVLHHNLTYLGLYVPAVIVLSVLQALVLNQEVKGMRVFRACFYLPVITSWVAGAIIWRFVLNGRWGFVNQWLGSLGILGPNWLEDPHWAMPGVVMACLWKDTGYYALIVLAALKSMDKNCFEAARVDGAGPLSRFFRITLPLLSPTLFLLFVYNLMSGFQVFEPIYIMTEGGPANATTVLVERIYRYAFGLYRMGDASALTIILFLLVLSVTVLQLAFEKRVSHGT